MWILREEVSYLGHVTGSTGVNPDEKRAEAVRNYPIPRITWELKGFVGLAANCRRIIPNFSKIAKPLTVEITYLTFGITKQENLSIPCQ